MPKIIAVCGASCSGKSTIASKLSAELNGDVGARVLRADDFFKFDQYLTDSCPLKDVGGRTWKDWESTASIDWDGLIQAVRRAAHEPTCPPYLIVEGFLLLAMPESRALFDAAIIIELSKSESWRRRRGRAESMAHLPPGLSNSAEAKNYEVLETYVRSDADRAAFNQVAAERYCSDGPLAWLHLYFEEVLWPAAEEQRVGLADVMKGTPVLRLDGDTPEGKEAWQDARLPEAVGFLRQGFE